MLAVDAGPIEKFIAPDEKELDPAGGPAFQKFRNVTFFADPDIDRDPGILLLKGRVFADLAIERQGDADFMTAPPQLARAERS